MSTLLARTNGGASVIEMRRLDGGLSAIPAADRGNWRVVIDNRPQHDPVTQSIRWSGVRVENDVVSIDYAVHDHPAPVAKMNLRQYAAQKRWQVETGGVTTPTGVRVGTAQGDQDKIDSILNAMDKGWISTVSFKAQSGHVTLNVAEMEGLAQVVLGHVQSCFAAEETVIAAIDAGTITVSQQIDDHGWPDN